MRTDVNNITEPQTPDAEARSSRQAEASNATHGNTLTSVAPADTVGPCGATAPPGEHAQQSSQAPPPLPQPTPPPPPPTHASAPGTADTDDSALNPGVHVPPAQVTAVYNTADLLVAFFNRRRDIEIRSHLDLRGLPLTPHELWRPVGVGSGGRLPVGRDLALLRPPIRSIRVSRRLPHARCLACGNQTSCGLLARLASVLEKPFQRSRCADAVHVVGSF